MGRNTVNTAVSVDPADALFLSWTTSINASGLFREALAEQMDYRDIDRAHLVALVDEATQNGRHNLDELIDSTTGLDHLEALVDESNSDVIHTNE